MIAAADTNTKAVWGIGANIADALTDAKKEMDEKPALAVAPSKLEFFPLTDDAPLHADGETLFGFIRTEKRNQTQMGLF